MSTYYTIMSMIDGFKSFINLAVMVLTIVASWIMYAKAGEHGWAAIVPFYSSYVKFRQGNRSCSGDILWQVSQV